MPNTKPKAASPDAAAAPEADLLIYEVCVKEVKIGGVIAYRTARVNLTKEQADKLNAAQADTVKFVGI